MGKLKLDNERFAKLLEAERLFHDILPEMDAAEECGIDCQEFRRLREEMMGQIDAMKRNFGPNAQLPK